MGQCWSCYVKDPFHLEVTAKSGKPRDRIHASKILTVVKKQHLLLCTLLISNAAAMETLPIFLDDLVPDLVAILFSVTLILLFGEIISQSVCSRYGLAIGAAVAPTVRVLMWFWFPVAYPISKCGGQRNCLQEKCGSLANGIKSKIEKPRILILGGALKL